MPPFRTLIGGVLLIASSYYQCFGQGTTPQVIRTDDGATIVFNTQESFFAFDLPATEIKRAPGPDEYMVVDARLIRASTVPDKAFIKGAGERVLLPKELLQAQLKLDLDEEQFNLQRPISAAGQEYITSSKGRSILHWWVELPAEGSKHGPTQRHYMTTVCNRDVLVLRAPLLPGDTPEQLRAYLLGAMSTVRMSDDPINVKEYAKTLRGTESK